MCRWLMPDRDFKKMSNSLEHTIDFPILSMVNLMTIPSIFGLKISL